MTRTLSDILMEAVFLLDSVVSMMPNEYESVLSGLYTALNSTITKFALMMLV